MVGEWCSWLGFLAGWLHSNLGGGAGQGMDLFVQCTSREAEPRLCWQSHNRRVIKARRVMHIRWDRPLPEAPGTVT